MHSILQWIQTLFKRSRGYMLLNQYPIFAQLGSYDLYLLDELVHTRQFKPGETIFELGYPLEVIYFVHSGEILLKDLSYSARDKILGKGEHLGILDLYHDVQRSATAVAKSKVVTHAISRTDLKDYIESRPRAGLKMLQVINQDICRILFDLAADKEHELD